jgi:xanthine dehydrogenase YagR molybdenum-binding subunit
MRQGDWLIGWGMAGGIWESMQMEGAAKATLTPDGHLQVSSATADIGTGTYTIMTQIAADTMGLPLEKVTFTLGDSTLPQAPVEGGSFTAATIGSAVKAACEKLRKRLLDGLQELDGSPLTGVVLDELELIDGRIQVRSDSSRQVPLFDLMRANNVDFFEEESSTKPSSKRRRTSCYAHSAVFAEVRIDEGLGVIQVPRIVSAVAGGRILNPKTARSQIMGGIVWGIGMALEEETELDHAFGRFMTRDLANYHVPVHADIHDIEVIFVEEKDEVVNPLGVKGLGELGVVGVAAAIANAFFHATGRRIHDLPITPDKIIDGLRY